MGSTLDKFAVLLYGYLYTNKFHWHLHVSVHIGQWTGFTQGPIAIFLVLTDPFVPAAIVAWLT